ncbi:hypothetical protein [Morganella morganii]|uniref:hypothetical protein n=1 Tax=Morganella morganii TaxID=582 RepID=UPI0024BA5ECE|nr:hypothetical protein [Morganella morganii]ELB1544948.1 hypothetical protein [Morganella morganii]HDU8310488.1 hypothetical protein [Morganella morganii subsp. sibonii]
MARSKRTGTCQRLSALPVIPPSGSERRWFYSFRRWCDPGGQGRVSGFPLCRLSRRPGQKEDDFILSGDGAIRADRDVSAAFRFCRLSRCPGQKEDGFILSGSN